MARQMLQQNPEMGEQQAWEAALREASESDWEYKAGTHRTIYDEEHHQNVADLTQKIAQTEGHLGQGWRHTGEEFPERHDTHPDHDLHSSPGDHWLGNIHTTPADISPSANNAHLAAGQLLNESLRPQEVTPPSDPYEESLEAAQGNLFTTSNDRHVSDLLKTMERVQMHDAVNDTFVKSIAPSQPYSLSNSTHVGVIAKQLSLANMDIHGIYHSQGDWEQVAKDWSVDLSTIKVIKATFGSVNA